MSPGVPLALPRSRTTPNVPAAVQRLGVRSVALCRITQRLMRQCGVTPLMNQFGEW